MADLREAEIFRVDVEADNIEILTSTISGHRWKLRIWRRYSSLSRRKLFARSTWNSGGLTLGSEMEAHA